MIPNNNIYLKKSKKYEMRILTKKIISFLEYFVDFLNEIITDNTILKSKVRITFICLILSYWHLKFPFIVSVL